MANEHLAEVETAQQVPPASDNSAATHSVFSADDGPGSSANNNAESSNSSNSHHTSPAASDRSQTSPAEPDPSNESLTPKDSANTVAHASCIACRLRRKKCDKKLAICTSCRLLNIPEHLCVYSHVKVGLKSKNSMHTLNLERERNEHLKNQLKNFKNLPNYLLDRRNIYTGGFNSNKDWKIRYGSLSWFTSIELEPELYELVHFIQQIGQRAADTLSVKEPVKITSISHLISHYDDEILEEFKDSLFLNNFKENPEDYWLNLAIKILPEIEKILPSYSILIELMQRFFLTNHLKCAGFAQLDEKTFRSNFNKVFKKIDNDKVKLIINSIRDITIISVTLPLVCYSIFILDQVFYPKGFFNVRRLNQYTAIILDLNLLANLNNIEANLIVAHETIQGFIMFLGYSLYLPNFIHDHRSPTKILMTMRVIINLCRCFHLNKNIETEYKDYEQSLRTSLKSVWYFLTYADLIESHELGIPTNIKHDEILIYSDFDNGIIRSLKKLNKIYSDLILYENDKISVFITKSVKYIRDLQKTMFKQFNPLTTDFRNHFENYELLTDKQISNHFKFIQSISIRLTIYSFIQSIYHIIYRRTNHPKYKILSSKYSFLSFSIVSRFFQCLQKKLIHAKDNHSSIFIILQSNYLTLPHVSKSMRKSGSIIFGFLSEFASREVKLKIATQILQNNHDATTTTPTNHNILEFFHMNDLADFDIDDDEYQLMNKFSNLNNYTFVSSQIYLYFLQITNSLNSKYFNQNSVKPNLLYFFFLKMSNIFFSLRNEVDNNLPNNGNNNPTKFNNKSIAGSEFDYHKVFQDKYNSSKLNNSLLDDLLKHNFEEEIFSQFDFNIFFNFSNHNYGNVKLDNQDLQDVIHFFMTHQHGQLSF